MDNCNVKENENRKNFFIICALILHIFSLYLVDCLQNVAYANCSTLIYMIVKFVLREFFLLVPICFMKFEHLKLKDIGITKNRLFTQVMIGCLIGIVETVVIVALTVLLGFKEQLGQPLYEESWQYVFYFFYAVFAVGLFEEVFFRGYLYKKLLDIRKSKPFAIIISSVMFGLCHFVGNGNILYCIPQVLLATVSGIFYCVLREKIPNCSLISLIFMHGIYDFCIAFLVYIL